MKVNIFHISRLEVSRAVCLQRQAFLDVKFRRKVMSPSSWDPWIVCLNMEALGSFEESGRRALEASSCPKFTLYLSSLRRSQTPSFSQFTIPVCPTPSQSCTVKHDVLTHTSSSPFKVCLRNSHLQLLLLPPTLFLQVFKSYYPLQQKCLI